MKNIKINKSLVCGLGIAIAIPLIVYASDFDLSEAETLGKDVYSEVTSSTLIRVIISVIIAVIGVIGLLTKRIDWGWFGIILLASFIIFKADTIAGWLIKAVGGSAT